MQDTNNTNGSTSNKISGGQSPVFDIDIFVDRIIKALKLGGLPPEELLRMKLEIEKVVSDRIIITVVNSLGQEELKLYQKMIQEDPTLDDLEALFIIAPKVDGIKEKLEIEIESLYDELTFQIAPDKN